MTRIRLTPGWEQHLEAPIDKMLTKITDEDADRARSAVPVDTGHLKNTIFSEVSNGVGRVGASADYATEVELGTSKQAAQPFLRPAVIRTHGGI